MIDNSSLFTQVRDLRSASRESLVCERQCFIRIEMLTNLKVNHVEEVYAKFDR